MDPKFKTFDAQRLVGDLSSAVWVPKAKHGNCEIKIQTIKAGVPQTCVGLRNSLFTGFKSLQVCFPGPSRITQLYEKGSLWMSDTPQEIFLHHWGVDAAKGKVLVGGLGIGYYATTIGRKAGVSNVTVVEINPNVIKLVQPYLFNPKIRVVQDDVWKYLATTKEKYDYVYLDIWRATGEHEYQKTVLPLRKLAKRVLRRGGKIGCWGEEEMLGQVNKDETLRRSLCDLDPTMVGK